MDRILGTPEFAFFLELLVMTIQWGRNPTSRPKLAFLLEALNAAVIGDLRAVASILNDNSIEILVDSQTPHDDLSRILAALAANNGTLTLSLLNMQLRALGAPRPAGSSTAEYNLGGLMNTSPEPVHPAAIEEAQWTGGDLTADEIIGSGEEGAVAIDLCRLLKALSESEGEESLKGAAGGSEDDYPWT